MYVCWQGLPFMLSSTLHFMKKNGDPDLLNGDPPRPGFQWHSHVTSMTLLHSNQMQYECLIQLTDKLMVSHLPVILSQPTMHNRSTRNPLNDPMLQAKSTPVFWSEVARTNISTCSVHQNAWRWPVCQPETWVLPDIAQPREQLPQKRVKQLVPFRHCYQEGSDNRTNQAHELIVSCAAHVAFITAAALVVSDAEFLFPSATVSTLDFLDI